MSKFFALYIGSTLLITSCDKPNAEETAKPPQKENTKTPTDKGGTTPTTEDEDVPAEYTFAFASKEHRLHGTHSKHLHISSNRNQQANFRQENNHLRI